MKKTYIMILAGLAIAGATGTYCYSQSSVAGMIASEGASGVVPENSVLRIKLQGELVERAGEGSPMDILSQGEETTIGLDQALEALKKAAGRSENFFLDELLVRFSGNLFNDI